MSASDMTRALEHSAQVLYELSTTRQIPHRCPYAQSGPHDSHPLSPILYPTKDVCTASSCINGQIREAHYDREGTLALTVFDDRGHVDIDNDSGDGSHTFHPQIDFRAEEDRQRPLTIDSYLPYGLEESEDGEVLTVYGKDSNIIPRDSWKYDSSSPMIQESDDLTNFVCQTAGEIAQQNNKDLVLEQIERVMRHGRTTWYFGTAPSENTPKKGDAAIRRYMGSSQTSDIITGAEAKEMLDKYLEDRRRYVSSFE
ncbi:uncharacterized protein I303_100429 [Kwoniella dejecticola CBS 10117]|uniref:Uncharacterized protein n=1 Tax=Kwoniella dejecticola CBS 10117 TaxID=1296121 RepID=A0A1A6AEX5_9TREE|nr:uncharacterized protein I303_00428 [Kwoniella dejecticola CBS 10117]OBR88611.1 hypothetical protein I303_00428 [Kwoniella dejecticola CBS 10117]